MFTGVRVVRGPDWKWGDQDGGFGCVGTVVEPNADSEFKTLVRWDSGEMANYQVGGAGGKFDLRIFDNAQIGVKHPNVFCDGCRQESILGIRWKCLICDDFDLCHICYNEGKHNLSHRFTRIETSTAPGVEVSSRQGATKCLSWGIFPGARVVRGPDWKWGNQDGGDGMVGTVSEVRGGEGTHRSLVTVHWPNRTKINYRVGHEGKVDLRYTEKERNGEFYIDHLPNLDATNVRPYVNAGDKVRLMEMNLPTLKELQSKRCGWNEEIMKFRGKVGEVIMVDRDGDIKVNFGESSCFIHPPCLAMEKRNETAKAPSEARVTSPSEGKGGDLNALLASLMLQSELLKLQTLLKDSQTDTPASGPALFNAAASGDTNKVREIIRSRPDSVNFQNSEGQTPLQAAALGGHKDVVVALVSGKANLEQRDKTGQTALAYAVLGKQPDIVKYLLLSGSNVNTSDKSAITPLHLAAAKGHPTCAEVLLKNKQISCDVNKKDSEGNTPVFVAIIKNDRQIIQLLLEHPGVDLRLRNNKGFNSLHHAVLTVNSFAVERILRADPSMINIQRNDDFTALHMAAFNGLADIVLTLVKQGNCNKDLKNLQEQTALHLAVAKCYNKCIEALVNNGANVNAQDKGGNTALHLVMMKASMKDIVTSTPMGKLLELVQQIGNEGKASDERSNLIAIAVYLIKNGANIYIRNNMGSNVLDVILSPGVKLLLRDLYEAKRATRATTPPDCKVS